MPILIAQLAILVAIAFIIGCILNRFAKSRINAGKDREDIIIAAAHAAPAIDEKPQALESPQAAVVHIAEPLEDEDEEKTGTPALQSTAEETEGPAQAIEEDEPEHPAEKIEEQHRPEWLEAPLRGKVDDLTAIKGIGAAVQGMLHELGIFHYSQIAQWNMEEAAWIERRIGFSGRVTRENWVAQAGKLAESARKPAPKRAAKPKKPASKTRATAPRRKKT
ncbi:endonuclease [Falsochrobactrum sp. TDYN1]|uniref:Endonuclease n=1 Tax=Falsochrobactrum tianjinense TaxID=2706015 RepID=A0A949UTT1_9HYPH|nr:endonuclease [Falsochrobactrum sp. TDYN1]MBV2142681.1 endonuclease [Falsochrobactrum sp. TDYN1]